MSKYASNFPHGIMFHHFHEETHPPCNQGSISAKDFEEILQYIGIENILAPDEWIFNLEHHKLKEKHVCLTFDDALSCQYDICVPVLEKYNLKCFWFVYSSVFEGELVKLEFYNYFRSKYFDHIDDFYELFSRKYEKYQFQEINKDKFEDYLHKRKRAFPFYSFNDLKFRFVRDEVLQKEDYDKLMDEIIEEKGGDITQLSANLWMTNSHLRELSDKGHLIGLHSYDHPTTLSRLSYDEQFDQYKRNYVHITRVCNKKAVVMSHPCNSYNNDTLEILRQFDILCGFRSNMTAPKGKKINASALEIAREDHSNILKKLQTVPT